MGTDRGEPMGLGSSGAHGADEGRTETSHIGTEPLVMRVVEYPDAADRCTIYPPDVDDGDRLTHWISANRHAFTALETQR